ncbi:MAG TPA: hypothetical protein VGG98_08320 [Solirubrobacteraceae bacterium]|jgi:hypothetical protein
MQNALQFVVFGAVALSVVMSLVFLLSRGSIYDQIGQDGFSKDSDPGGRMAAPAPDSAAGRAEREQEIRQMLSARSERLVRAGRPALDIDAEVTKLLEPSRATGRSGDHEAGLVEEVRQLVLARNERRVRKGQPPLDVDAEVERTLAELDP